MTTLTNDQITAGAAVLCDHDQPIGRNAAIAVFDAMQAASPQVADIAELAQQLRAAANRPTMPGREPGSVLVHASLLRIAADAIAASRRAAAPASAGQAAPALTVDELMRVVRENWGDEAAIERAFRADLSARLAAQPAEGAGHPKCHKCHGNSITHASFCPLFDSAKEQNAMQVYRAGQAAPAGVSMPEKMPDAVEEQIMGHLYRGVTRGAGPRQIYDSIRSVLAAQPAEVSANQPEHVAELTISSTGLSLLTRSYTATDKALGEGSYKLYLGPAEVRMSPVNVTKAIKG